MIDTQAIADRSTHAIPCLCYTDAHAAIAWLRDTLGAHVAHVYEGPDDTVAHGEIWFGTACVMLGSVNENGSMPQRAPGHSAVYVALESAGMVDALHARAVAAGARIVLSLRDTDYGSRDFGCLDCEGNFWDFGTYVPQRAEQPSPAMTTTAG